MFQHPRTRSTFTIVLDLWPPGGCLLAPTAIRLGPPEFLLVGIPGPQSGKGPLDSHVSCSQAGPRLEARGTPQMSTVCFSHLLEVFLANLDLMLGQRFEKRKEKRLTFAGWQEVMRPCSPWSDEMQKMAKKYSLNAP